MNEILHIEWDSGYMNIVKDAFFPCSLSKMNFLLKKVIALDWKNRDEILKNLKVYFQEKIPEFDAAYKAHGKEHFHYKQLAADTRRMVESKKRPNGVPLTKDELKTARDQYTEYDTKAKEYLSEAKAFQRKKNQIQSNLNCLETFESKQRW